jgi:hypothetical protein
MLKVVDNKFKEEKIMGDVIQMPRTSSATAPASCPTPCPDNKSKVTIQNLKNGQNSTKNSVTAKSGSPNDSTVTIENGFNTTDTSENSVDLSASAANNATVVIYNHDNQSNGGVNVVVF